MDKQVVIMSQKTFSLFLLMLMSKYWNYVVSAHHSADHADLNHAHFFIIIYLPHTGNTKFLQQMFSRYTPIVMNLKAHKPMKELLDLNDHSSLK